MSKFKKIDCVVCGKEISTGGAAFCTHMRMHSRKKEIMEIKYLKDEKNEAEIEMDNSTVAEILRAYLNKDSSVEFAAWKKEHPTKNPVLKIKTKGKSVKKALSDAATMIEKDGDKLVADFKKGK